MQVVFSRHWAARATLLGGLVSALYVAPVASAQVVIPPIAPPKPAVPRAANAIVISTGDLNAALNWARQGAFADATTSFKLFKDDWQTVVDDVRQQSADIAKSVDDAIADVVDVVDDQPPPAQSTYFPAFQKLAQVVEDANTQLGLIAPVTNALRISTTDLAQSVTWASQGNLAKTHDEFDQFRDDWSLVRDAVRQQLPAQAEKVDAATAAVQAIVSNPANLTPAPSQYFPALQNLQQIVLDTNAQLASMASPVAAPASPAASPIKIQDGNLGESVDWAGDGNLARARSEFSQFQDDWKSVADAVRRQQADVADHVENAIAEVQTIFGASAPAKEEYFPALQNLQQVVEDANKQLGN
jgi:methyl-accepting chemotaxis protein